MFDNELKDLQAELIAHPIYSAVATMDDLHRFMQAHIFAVWDFISLVKRLQAILTCIQIPWLPPKDESAARLINDIVFGKESDVDRAGNPASHLTLYLTAMREVGASSRMFDTFLGHMRQGTALDASFDAERVPRYIRQFVHPNIRLARQRHAEEVTGNFLFGRKDAIPKMFRTLLTRWGVLSTDAPNMVYYLERHIALDSKQHGPEAMSIFEKMIGGDRDRFLRAQHSAFQALRARIHLWDGILSKIRSTR